MSDQTTDERDQAHESGLERQFRRDPLGTYVWGFILVWAGVVFLLDQTGALDNLVLVLPPGMFPAINTTWTLVFLGAGLIASISILLRYLIPGYPRPFFGSFVFAVIMIGLALGSLFGYNIIWPILLIGLGVLVLLRSFFRRGRAL